MFNGFSKRFNRDNIFAFMERLGQSFMIPIAIMPIAGFLLAIGASFTNPVNVESLGLTAYIHDGTVLSIILKLMQSIGKIILDNLPLLFTISVAIGFSNRQKEIGAVSAILAFISMHQSICYFLTISGYLTLNGEITSLALDGMIVNVLGIQTLQVGVFGGILLGFIVAKLNNRYNEIKFPKAFSFFEGSRFIPIVSIIVSLFIGLLFFLVWPPIQNGILDLSGIISSFGVLGAFLFSTIKRLLIPFGLHHIFYLPFWQTSLGGTEVINGVTYVGAQNIYFAQLANPSLGHISANVTQYFGGEFAAMIFGLPAGAYAIYRHSIKKNNKSFLESASLTSAIVGITEPIEFQIIPVAPLLFVFHAIMCGVCNAVQLSLNFAVGCTFSSGLIDLILLGILPGADRTSWFYIIPIGIAMAVIYYVAFTIVITKFNINFDMSDTSIDDEERIKLIVEGLGGAENIAHSTSCATRLRVMVNEPDLVNEDILNKTGVLHIQQQGTGVQLVFGTGVTLIQSQLEEYLNKGSFNRPDNSFNDNLHHEESEHNSLGSSEMIEIKSPLSGTVIPLDEVPDDTFASGVLGDGIAIDPNDGEVKAPDDGTIVFIAPTKHAIGFMCDNGISLLIHLGIDTVKLDGKGFECLINETMHVNKGTTMIKMDLDYIKDQGLSVISPIVCTELKDGQKITNKSNLKSVKFLDNIFTIENK